MLLPHQYVHETKLAPVEVSALGPEGYAFQHALQKEQKAMFIREVDSLFCAASNGKTIPEFVLDVRKEHSKYAACWQKKCMGNWLSCLRQNSATAFNYPQMSLDARDSFCRTFKDAQQVCTRCLDAIRNIGEFCVLLTGEHLRLAEANTVNLFPVQHAVWPSVDRFCFKAACYFNIIAVFGKFPAVLTASAMERTPIGPDRASYLRCSGWGERSLANPKTLLADFNELQEKWKRLKPNL